MIDAFLVHYMHCWAPWYVPITISLHARVELASRVELVTGACAQLPYLHFTQEKAGP